MTNLTNIQKCLVTRNGIEIWLDEDKWTKLEQVLNSSEVKRFINIEDRIVNIADIVGIYKPEDLNNRDKRKNGEWKCKEGEWHGRNEKCECLKADERNKIKRREELIKNCGKCNNGYLKGENTFTICDCLKELNN